MKMLNIYKILIVGVLLSSSIPVYASIVNITEVFDGFADGSTGKQSWSSTFYQTNVSNEDVLGDVSFHLEFYNLDGDDADEFLKVLADGYNIFTTIPEFVVEDYILPSELSQSTPNAEFDFTVSETLFEEMIADGVLNWEFKGIDVLDVGKPGAKWGGYLDERLELEISYEISDQQVPIIPIYNVNTQVLNIPMIRIGSNAYQVEMELFSTDPTIGFVFSGFTDLGKIADDEDIAVIYDADNNSILLPTVIILNADSSEVELNNLNLALTIEGNDIFFWIYEPEEE